MIATTAFSIILSEIQIAVILLAMCTFDNLPMGGEKNTSFGHESVNLLAFVKKCQHACTICIQHLAKGPVAGATYGSAGATSASPRIHSGRDEIIRSKTRYVESACLGAPKTCIECHTAVNGFGEDGHV